MSLHDLPKYPNLNLAEGASKPAAPPLNEQNPEVFRQKRVEARRTNEEYPVDPAARNRNRGDPAILTSGRRIGGSYSQADGRAKTVFHRYGEAYFLAAISDGSWQSTDDFGRSNKEEELAGNSPTRQPEVVSVLSKPTAVTAAVGRKK